MDEEPVELVVVESVAAELIKSSVCVAYTDGYTTAGVGSISSASCIVCVSGYFSDIGDGIATVTGCLWRQ